MNDTQPEYVGFWLRVVASIIDSILAGLILGPLVTWIYGDRYSTLEWIYRGDMMGFVFNGILPAVAVILFWIYRQATPGKMAIGAKIVDEKTLGKPSTGQLIGRYLGYYVSILPLFLGLIWVGIDPRKQGFHDKLAGTLVIRARKEVKASGQAA